MVLKVIRPEKETFDMRVSLPKNYLGKNVYCLIYIKEEAQHIPATRNSAKKPSDFFGILNQENGEEFERHVLSIRGEWDR